MPEAPHDGTAEGPPWFIVAVLFDGDSLEFYEFIQQRLMDLDRATGRGIHIAPIGNPLQGGKVYSRLRSDKRAAQDNADAQLYSQLAASRGGEGHHRQWETDEIVEALGIDRADLPCLAFRTTPIFRPVPLLRVERNWLRSAESRDALSNALRRHLSEERLVSLGTPGRTSVGQLALGLDPILEDVQREMAFAMTIVGGAAAAGNPPKWRLPPGARWNEIALRFVGEWKLEIRFRSKCECAEFGALGFEDRRTKQPRKPNKQWELLHEFADARGHLDLPRSVERGKYEKRVEELSRSLRNVFGLDDAPITLDRAARTWSTRFSIRPEDD